MPTQPNTTHPKRSTARIVASLAGVAALLLTLAPQEPAGAATKRVATKKTVRRVPAKKRTVKTAPPNNLASYSIAIRDDVKSAAPGSSVDYEVVFTGSTGGITWDVPDLPTTYTYALTPITSNTYRFRVAIPGNVDSSSTVYVLKARRGAIERTSLFRIVVTAPPKPTAPTTTVAAPVDFALKAEVQQRIALIGETAAFPITVDRKGYTGPISFIADGAPNGATVGYSPNPSTGNTTLYVTPQATTRPGRSLIIVSAKVGNEIRSTAVELITRKFGPFDATVIPALAKTSPGNDARFTISLSATGGLPYVDLTVKGLPAGATLRTTSVATASTPLIITTSKTTPAGTYPITIALTSGSYSRQMTASLVVDPQLLFSVTPDSSTVTVRRGSSVGLSATVARADGFTETLGYQINGLPAGVGATYEWTPTGVQIRFTATDAAPTGSFPIDFVITGAGRATTTGLALVVT